MLSIWKHDYIFLFFLYIFIKFDKSNWTDKSIYSPFYSYRFINFSSRTSSDKQIRHEACSLRDHAYALVEVEMDSDFEEDCRVVADRRAAAGTAMDQDLPNFIFTANHSSEFYITCYYIYVSQLTQWLTLKCFIYLKIKYLYHPLFGL